MIKQLYAQKSHMEQTFVDGHRLPLTCLRVFSHTALNSSPSRTLVIVGRKRPITRYVQSEGDTPIDNQPLDLDAVLQSGKLISVTATSKGKGFSGVVKRWGFATQPRTHGQSDRHRAPGSIARGTTPGRIVKGKHMAGRMGNDQKTVKNLKIISFDKTSGILKVTGPIPGAPNALVKVTII